MSGRADALRRQEAINAAAGAEVEHGLAQFQAGQGDRIAAAEGYAGHVGGQGGHIDSGAAMADASWAPQQQTHSRREAGNDLAVAAHTAARMSSSRGWGWCAHGIAPLYSRHIYTFRYDVRKRDGLEGPAPITRRPATSDWEAGREVLSHLAAARDDPLAVECRRPACRVARCAPARPSARPGDARRSLGHVEALTMSLTLNCWQQHRAMICWRVSSARALAKVTLSIISSSYRRPSI